ncbi:MAG: hypothetical protein H0T47_19070 [Planctomycetaceae bacterium]|nr:hypothetical protein [Planctomycetaceae bacterium]
MPSLLFVVEEVFDLSGRSGLTLVPGLTADSPQARVGDPIELRRPNGTSQRTRISAIESLTANVRRIHPIVLPSEIEKQDVPIGTEVWQGVE